MKVALLAESFLPHMNGVTHSLLQVLRHLERRGHETLVVAPRSGPVDRTLAGGARTILLPSVPLPSYPEVRVTLAGAGRIAGILRTHGADVVHLASPFVLGWRGVLAAEAAGVPSVAVYQTDVPAYAARYGVPAAEPALTRHLAKLHRRATLTLAPSSSARERLESLGVERLRTWRRGIDTERFAPSRRDESWRRGVAPRGETIVGYVGRLAAEKQVDDLAALAGMPGIRLVVVGDGPSRGTLERRLPGALFTGFLGGDELATAMAGLDVFVHPGEHETFCQTVQEALASGVPVVATGRGGPLDLVEQSRNGWLYRPGDLREMRSRVQDLVGDAAKRRAFAERARESVLGRGWDRLGDELIGHYEDAAGLRPGSPGRRPARPAAPAPVATRPAAPSPAVPPVAPRPRRYVAVGDSLTEGLCDTSRTADGSYRGWADRLAMLLALAAPQGAPVAYANLAVRSRKVHDVVEEQLPRALELGADLVSVLIGGNDLVGRRVDPEALAHRLGDAVARARATGCEVLVVTPFLPGRPEARPLVARFARFNAVLAGVAEEHGARLVDVAAEPALTGRDRWAEDRVHLNSAGHRGLAYAAALALGIPDAGELGALELALHDDAADPGELGDLAWLRRHVVPWALRRLRGRTAGEGIDAKRDALEPVALPSAPAAGRPRTLPVARSAG
ncbi:GDSL-type esterase/lipase family protein [Agromyces sp. NPDC058104]|uniref:GDSL-type esterase/lipase family protein n=1 Tax=Agromyces sp. NPDC058104 TaxID=3346342 RepID=UPI0036DCC322